jgi:hypothetical protein
MSTAARTCLERRRSTRFPIRFALLVCGEEEWLPEETWTFSVNAHGALVALAATMTAGQRLIIHNPENRAERCGRVTRLGRCYAGRTEVGIEFTEPAPDFWLIRASSKTIHVD